MAQFKTDKRIKNAETGDVHEPNTPFEMTIKRAEEMKKNIKEKYNVNVNFTRLDEPDNAEGDKKEEEKKEKEKGKA